MKVYQNAWFRTYSFLLFIFSLLASSSPCQAQDEEDVMQYIETFKKLAVAEQIRSGVPAAITLAQGIHESAAGKSELATKGNNHFGIKCKTTWTGETILHDDDQRQECFRKYSSAEQSYLDHSNFLRAGSRYAFLFDLDVTDYKGWASGLKRAGYATNPAYVRRLTDLVEKYNLQQFTYEAQGKAFQTVGEKVPETDATRITQSAPPSDPVMNSYKGLKGFWAKKGDMLLDRAIEWNIRYPRLLVLNELNDAPLPYDMFVFTEKKRKIGTEEFHVVKAGETLHMIAQKEAILLENLMAFNNLTDAQEPETGEKLALQYRSYETPKLKPKFLPALSENRQTTSSPEVRTETREQVIPKTEEPIASTPVIKEVEVVHTPVEAKPTEAATTEVIRTEESKPQQLVKQEETKPEEVVSEKIQEKVDTPVVEVAKTKTEIPNHLKISEEPKRQESLVTPRNADPTATPMANPTDIIDTEKARRTEALLTGDANRTQIPDPPAPVPENTTPEVVTINPEKSVPVVIETTPEPVAPKRTYDEPGVSDSVKKLKEKFDAVVYRPLPPRKKVSATPVNTPSVTPKPANTATTPKTNTLPKANEKDTKPQDKTSGKNADVKVTKTGIVRQPKKEEAAKDKAGNQKNAVNKDGKSGKNTKTDKNKNAKESPAKKSADKKSSDKKTNGKGGKEKDAKNTKDKDIKNKKTKSKK